MHRFIRHRLFTILLLGVLTSALSVVALVQLLQTSNASRVERGRDAVVEELDRLAADPDVSAPSSYVGMRAGEWIGDRAPAALPEVFVAPVQTVVTASRAEGHRVVREIPVEGGTMVVAAQAGSSPSRGSLFSVFFVRPLPSLRTWQRIVSLLAGATVLLVVTALSAVVTVNRGASALRRSLDALANDLRAPVPRPSVRELDAIADGIQELATKLADARVKEERLARELAQNERLAALGRVAAGVAHEVRNPLASIKLRLDLAAASSALPEPVDKAIAHATSEIDRLDRLVADLLVVAGRAVGPKAKTDLGALVRARIDGLEPWAKEHGVTLEASGGVEARVDADSMARAVDNLLRNAVEASAPAGRVAVRMSCAESTVFVRVEDHGAGIAEGRAAELFEPFFTTKPSGTGLGLALSRAIARAHGGDVIHAREGDVTSFTVALPALPDGRDGTRVSMGRTT